MSSDMQLLFYGNGMKKFGFSDLFRRLDAKSKLDADARLITHDTELFWVTFDTTICFVNLRRHPYYSLQYRYKKTECPTKPAV
jgi:hypothetical protein